MKYVIISFVLLLALFLWLVNGMESSNVSRSGRVFIPESSVTGSIPNEPIIAFEYKKVPYYLKLQNPKVLYLHQGDNVNFNIDFNKIVNPTDSIFINGKYSYLIKADISVSFNGTNLANYIIGWLQLLIAIITSAICLFLWKSNFKSSKAAFHRNEDDDRNKYDDFGIFYISAALILWSVIGVFRIYSEGQTHLEFSVLVISTINNLFFLMSFPHFIYGIKWINENKYKYLIYVLCVFIAGITGIIWFENGNAMPFITLKNPSAIADWIDVIITITTLTILSYLLFNSFKERKLNSIAWLSVLWLISAVIGQTENISEGVKNNMGYFFNINYIASSITLDILITALMFSWYSEQKEILELEDQEDQRIKSDFESITENKKIEILLRNLIVKDKIKIAIEGAEKVLRKRQDVPKEIFDELAQMSNRLEQYSKGKRTNSVSPSDLSVEYNKIVIALLDFINATFGH